MPPPLLVDINEIDLDNIVFDIEAIEAVNPHRHEMRLLDGIVYFDKKDGTIVGLKNVRQDEFWVRGHIPGRPLMPGVLMVEAAAQLASFSAQKIRDISGFVGFGGIEKVKFRIAATPGCKLYLLGKFIEIRRRRFVFEAQGIIDGKLAFEGRIIGMPM